MLNGGGGGVTNKYEVSFFMRDLTFYPYCRRHVGNTFKGEGEGVRKVLTCLDVGKGGCSMLLTLDFAIL